MTNKEARARIKINNLLREADWRFFKNEKGPANIQLEPNVKITKKQIDAFGENFEKVEKGVIDFLLLDNKGFPFVVLEAKREEKDPLDGKEQARAYAKSQDVRFVILSNGNLHYFWDLETGNPEVITEFPTQQSLLHRLDFKPNNIKLADENVDKEYLARTQLPGFEQDPSWQNIEKREKFIKENNLMILRDYQLDAIYSLQSAAAKGKTRYLFEMATGTGKTLVSAAVIKLFLRTGNAKRILFLVDRISLEEQAFRSFKRYLSNDCVVLRYRNHKDGWRKAEIVVTTVQSLTVQDKYKKLFSPTDFDLLISDEAHRSINGNRRAVFEYFIGYKLGLTATPKDYLKNIDIEKLSRKDPRAWERRQLLDTYTTFGCKNGVPTYRYNLVNGVKDGYLVSPTVADARTEITTQLLSDKGYAVMVEQEEGEEVEEVFYHRDFERKFFSKKTNNAFCKIFLENALKDPLSNEIGKSIVFCVSQDHASKITQILNKMAHKLWPGKYNSDFAMQITSRIPNSQDFTVNFRNNNLSGYTKFLENYKTSKTRVCVTVGMMTTGYDCKDVLNLALMRPIFSPTNFIQIKGRGTRIYTFEYQDKHRQNHKIKKDRFKILDFFANYEYFEEEYDYDEILALPKLGSGTNGNGGGIDVDELEIFDPDKLKELRETDIGVEGMKVDRKLFGKARDQIVKDKDIKKAVENEQWPTAVKLTRERYEDKPELYLTLEKIRKSEQIKRRITWQEVLQRIFGLIDKFKTKDEKLEEECEKFISIYKPKSQHVPSIKNYLKAYLTDRKFRDIVESGNIVTGLSFYPGYSVAEYKALDQWKSVLPEYIKDYVPINTYME